ncbi:MAG: prepilin-type N-terminal cleavage/methylation domain-containing protein, partial [Gammaproteobacteria bacterium]|nr:prepilin-type N-terminal cleavage/methylation domain-containing protein [Gammaproteobacteria bacterium]
MRCADRGRALPRALPPEKAGSAPAPARSEVARGISVTAASVSGARRGLWSAGRTAARGFTLIELLVVMVLIVIVIGTVGLGLGGSDSRAVQQ